MTAPKSQNGSLLTSSRVLSASNAPQPPSLDCIPASQASPRSMAAWFLRALAGPAQREHDLGGVVGVGVVVVVELERPAARGQVRPAHLPVARAADLLAEHPARGAGQRGVIGGQARVGQRDHGQHGVPDRRLARLQAAHRAVRAVLGDREPVKAGQARGP